MLEIRERGVFRYEPEGINIGDCRVGMCPGLETALPVIHVRNPLSAAITMTDRNKRTSMLSRQCFFGGKPTTRKQGVVVLKPDIPGYKVHDAR
jgi:hypothetical protein